MSNKELIKTLREKLNKLDTLEKTNKNLSEQIQNLNDKLKESEQLKTNFISNVMNELVNPFSSILGLSENIVHLENDQMDKAKAIASMIYNEAVNIDFQLTNIFTAARLEAGETAPVVSKVDVISLIKSIIENYQTVILKNKIEIELKNRVSKDMTRLYYFNTDLEKLKLIVNNRLSNAIKYSPKEGKILVEVSIEEKMLIVRFTDSGSGINQSDLKEIFDRFKQLDKSVSTLNPGHGLGLSIVKALTDLLSGEITVSSAEGKGTTFTLKLPEFSDEETRAISDPDGILFDETTF
jgi:signal transduction histidine kinase